MRALKVLLCTGAAAIAAAPAASAKVRDYWVATTPAPTWNIVPNQRDAITGTTFAPADTLQPTVVYRRYTRGWKRPLPGTGIPGPLIKARVGDRIRVHFKNLDTLWKQPHSMHFHGVDYRPESDGAYIPGYSGPGGSVAPGKQFTYRLTVDPGSAGAWPYHDHSPSMSESIEGGIYGMLSIVGRKERRADREFTVVLAPMGRFQTIAGRAFVGNTPVFRARAGETVQWNVMAMGSEFHTFHVHGHKWRENGVGRDTRTIGPAESFRIRWREDAPGTWLYHCHVEDHMGAGMIGTYRVAR